MYTTQMFQHFHVTLINLFTIIFADLLVAEFIERPALVPGRLHCLYRLAQTLGSVIHELVKERDLSQTNVLLGERAEYVEDPYWPLPLPVTNHSIE